MVSNDNGFNQDFGCIESETFDAEKRDDKLLKECGLKILFSVSLFLFSF